MPVNITCYKCKMVFAMPDDFYNSMKQLAEKGIFYCPAGHGQCFNRGETDEDKMRRERDKAIQDRAYWQDRCIEKDQRLEEEKRKAAAARGQITKIKNRVGKGVCPCCNRTFQNLANHMKTQHAEFHSEAA